MRDIDLGRTTVKLGSVTVPIFDRERTIIDAFRYLGVETAIKALKAGLKKKGAQKLNLERLQLYAKELRVDIQPYLLAVTI
jgi:hypothetical protein